MTRHILRVAALATTLALAGTAPASAAIIPTLDMPPTIEAGAAAQGSFTFAPSIGGSLTSPDVTGIVIGHQPVHIGGGGSDPLTPLRVISGLQLGAMSGADTDKVSCTIALPNGIDCALAIGFAGPATVSFSFVAPKSAVTLTQQGRPMGGVLGTTTVSAGGPSSLSLAPGPGFPTKVWLGDTAPASFTVTNAGPGAARFVLVGSRSMVGLDLQPVASNLIAVTPDSRCVRWSDDYCMIDVIAAGETVTLQGVLHAGLEYFGSTIGMGIQPLHAKADMNQDPLPSWYGRTPSGASSQVFPPLQLTNIQIVKRPATEVVPMYLTPFVTSFLRSGNSVNAFCTYACTATARFDVPAAVQKALRLKTTTIASGAGSMDDAGLLTFKVTVPKSTLTALRRYRGPIGITRTVIVNSKGAAPVRGVHTLAPERIVGVFDMPAAKIAVARRVGIVIRYQCPAKCTSTGKVTVSRAVQRQLGLASPTLGTAKGTGRKAGEHQLVVRLFPSAAKQLARRTTPVAVSVRMRVEMRAQANHDLVVTKPLRLVP